MVEAREALDRLDKSCRSGMHLRPSRVGESCRRRMRVLDES